MWSSTPLSPKAAEARRTTKLLRDILQGYKALLESSLREEGLTLPQLRLLHVVAEETEVSSAAIARLCQITPQTLQIMLTRAVREGWLVRSTSAKNHRILTASLTPKGEAVLKRGEVMAMAIEKKLWTGTSLASLKEANAVLDAAKANLQAELDQLKTE